MIRVLVADDHAIVRQGVRQILSETPDIVVVDEAAHGQEVVDKVRQKPFDLVLLDISMPGPGGLEVLRQIKADNPNLPVLILSIHSEELYALRTLKAGAAGYLTKGSAPNELTEAIRKVFAGRKYITASLAERLAGALGGGEQPLHGALSDREFQVLKLIASGRAVSEIASELCLSVKTISTYRARILEKMQMKNNAELMQYAVKNQLIE